MYFGSPLKPSPREIVAVVMGKGTPAQVAASAFSLPQWHLSLTSNYRVVGLKCSRCLETAKGSAEGKRLARGRVHLERCDCREGGRAILRDQSREAFVQASWASEDVDDWDGHWTTPQRTQGDSMIPGYQGRLTTTLSLRVSIEVYNRGGITPMRWPAV